MTKKTGFTKDQKEEFSELFAEAFHDVVSPVIVDLKEELGNRIETLNRRIYQVTDSQAKKLDNHEKRIKKLESKQIYH